MLLLLLLPCHSAAITLLLLFPRLPLLLIRLPLFAIDAFAICHTIFSLLIAAILLYAIITPLYADTLLLMMLLLCCSLLPLLRWRLRWFLSLMASFDFFMPLLFFSRFATIFFFATLRHYDFLSPATLICYHIMPLMPLCCLTYAPLRCCRYFSSLRRLLFDLLPLCLRCLFFASATLVFAAALLLCLITPLLLLMLMIHIYVNAAIFRMMMLSSIFLHFRIIFAIFFRRLRWCCWWLPSDAIIFAIIAIIDRTLHAAVFAAFTRHWCWFSLYYARLFSLLMLSAFAAAYAFSMSLLIFTLIFSFAIDADLFCQRFRLRCCCIYADFRCHLLADFAIILCHVYFLSLPFSFRFIFIFILLLLFMPLYACLCLRFAIAAACRHACRRFIAAADYASYYICLSIFLLSTLMHFATR